jgi:hypothetical protein
MVQSILSLVTGFDEIILGLNGKEKEENLTL